MESQVYQRIGSVGVVPVITIEDVQSVLPLADALIEGGLPIAEITFRTSAAAAVIEKMSKERPQVLVGAGTVLTADNLRLARDCGASFGVAPGFNPAVVEQAVRLGLPFFPGVMTPSDIEGALSMGMKVLKFFPAGAAGGVKMLTSIAAPFAHTGVKFVPTGGINAGNLAEYVRLDLVVAVGGTWIATRDDIKSGRWDVVRNNCREAVAAVQQARGR